MDKRSEGQFPISHVKKVSSMSVMGRESQVGHKDSSGIADMSNTALYRGRSDYTAAAKIPDSNNKLDASYAAGKGDIVAVGKGKTYQEAYNNASTKRTEGLKSGAFAKPNEADENWAKTSREQAAKGNPNYKPIPVIKISSDPAKGK